MAFPLESINAELGIPEEYDVSDLGLDDPATRSLFESTCLQLGSYFRTQIEELLANDDTPWANGIETHAQLLGLAAAAVQTRGEPSGNHMSANHIAVVAPRPAPPVTTSQTGEHNGDPARDHASGDPMPVAGVPDEPPVSTSIAGGNHGEPSRNQARPNAPVAINPPSEHPVTIFLTTPHHGLPISSTRPSRKSRRSSSSSLSDIDVRIHGLSDNNSPHPVDPKWNRAVLAFNLQMELDVRRDARHRPVTRTERDANGHTGSAGNGNSDVARRWKHGWVYLGLVWILQPISGLAFALRSLWE